MPSSPPLPIGHLRAGAVGARAPIEQRVLDSRTGISIGTIGSPGDPVSKSSRLDAATPPGGRLGLALSGGGFRAAMFHLGVLARMAELGLLRRVEVISTVSGGSVIGALYYLHVKRLLERVPDAELTDDHFRGLVTALERDLVRGVQGSVFARTLDNPGKTLKMTLPDYSRSTRIGELYDELFFTPAWPTARTAPIALRELRIVPAGVAPAGRDLDPLTMNLGRRTPVPVLEINATSLNTGRGWRFSPGRMGEPPFDDPISDEIDKRDRLRRPPSYDALPRHADLSLGMAVAASACVPGLLPPLALRGVYGRDVLVELVDGGVIDNQGISACLEHGCDRLVVSDGAGQLGFEPRPDPGPLAVVARMNNVLLDRVRELELRAVLGARSPVATALVHLKKGLTMQAFAWNGPDGEEVAAPRREPAGAPTSAAFGVDPRVQELLASVRTDLDVFSDVEALSLAADAYQIADGELRGQPRLAEWIVAPPAEAPPPAEPPWRFLAIRELMAHPTPGYLLLLGVAREQLFRYFRLVKVARWIAFALLALIGVGLWFLVGGDVSAALRARVEVWHALVALLVPAVLFSFGASAVRRRGLFSRVKRWALYLRDGVLYFILAVLGAPTAFLHRRAIDPRLLAHGALDRHAPRKRDR